MLWIQLSWGQQTLWWYAAIAASVYLFVGSQWEAARAEELDEEFSPESQIIRGPELKTGGLEPHLTFDSQSSDDAEATEGYSSGSFAPSGDNLGEQSSEQPAAITSPDIDEILRKVHRSGQESLTEEERQALISASHEIQASRDAKRQ